MTTLEAFVFINETADPKTIAEIWNRNNGTWITANDVAAIAETVNVRTYKISF